MKHASSECLFSFCEAELATTKTLIFNSRLGPLFFLNSWSRPCKNCYDVITQPCRFFYDYLPDCLLSLRIHNQSQFLPMLHSLNSHFSHTWLGPSRFRYEYMPPFFENSQLEPHFSFFHSWLLPTYLHDEGRAGFAMKYLSPVHMNSQSEPLLVMTSQFFMHY